MKHKWKKVKKYKDKCTVCNCIRESDVHKTNGKWYKFYIYIRSGIVFSGRPDCINWEEEDNKTID